METTDICIVQVYCFSQYAAPSLLLAPLFAIVKTVQETHCMPLKPALAFVFEQMDVNADCLFQNKQKVVKSR